MTSSTRFALPILRYGCVISGFYVAILKASSIMFIWWVSRLALTNTLSTLRASMTERQGHACLSSCRETMATILIRETLWSAWKRENVGLQRKQAGVNPLEMGQRNYSGRADWIESETLIKRQAFCVAATARVYALTSAALKWWQSREGAGLGLNVRVRLGENQRERMIVKKKKSPNTANRHEAASYFPSLKKVLRASLKLLEYFTKSFFCCSSA